MSQPQILYAHDAGTHFFKLTGELRITDSGSFASSLTLNTCIEHLLRDAQVRGVVVDLREAEAMDSTHLGLVAHIGAATLERTGVKAVAVSTESHITQLLQGMALDTVLEVVTAHEAPDAALATMESNEDAAADHTELVLRAHQELARLSSRNAAQFKPLISLLEADQGQERDK